MKTILHNPIPSKVKQMKQNPINTMFKQNQAATSRVHRIQNEYEHSTVKPRFNVPTFSEIPDLVMIFSCPDNSSI
jgi:hypothetical protein